MKRDEVERLEAAVRNANPVPCVIDLRDSDEAVAVTFLLEQRSRIMTTTAAHTALRPTGPLRPRRSMVWAFAAGCVLVVLVVGAAALLLGGDVSSVVDESERTVATTPELQSTPSTPALAGAESGAYGGWEWIELDQPWVGSVVDSAPLPGGGFVVAATDQWSVLWSPDGIDWRDADPQREVTVLPLTRAFMGSRPELVTTIGDQVVLLDSTVFGIRIGDVETKRWDSIGFEASDLAGNVGLLMIAANDTHVLVIGYEDDYTGEPLADDSGRIVECGENAGGFAEVESTRYLAWLVDPRSGEVRRSFLPVGHGEDMIGLAAWWAGARVCGEVYGSVAWFKDQWVLNLAELWFVSEDGVFWTHSAAPADSEPMPATLVAGPDTLLAEVWNGLWYSETGTDWTELPEAESTRRGPSEAAYSPAFGYVATPWSDPGLYVSTDGRNWRYAGYWPDVGDLTASGDRILALVEFARAYLFVYSGRFEFPDSSVVVELPGLGEVLLDQDDDFVANVAVGDAFSISLPGFPPAGSGWRAVESPDGLWGLVEGPVFEHEDGGEVWEGTYRFTFEALEVGSGELVFEYCAPGDTGGDVYMLTVDIDA